MNGLISVLREIAIQNKRDQTQIRTGGFDRNVNSNSFSFIHNRNQNNFAPNRNSNNPIPNRNWNNRDWNNLPPDRNRNNFAQSRNDNNRNCNTGASSLEDAITYENEAENDDLNYYYHYGSHETLDSHNNEKFYSENEDNFEQSQNLSKSVSSIENIELDCQSVESEN